VSLSAATVKSVIGVSAPAQFGVDLLGYELAFDGVSAAAVPVLVTIEQCTFATNAPGTNSTTRTPVQNYGRSITTGFTAASNWTTEPTVLTVSEEKLITPNGSTYRYVYPLGQTPDSAVSTGFVLRCNAPATVNVRATLYFERC
jgi:hypothetical protein